MAMSSYPSVCCWRKFLLRAAVALSLVPCAFPVYGNQGKGKQAQPVQEAPQEEKKDMEVPKPPKDDFTVEVYRTLDEKKVTTLKMKDKYRHDKMEEDVEVILSYFNWGVSDDDYWNRQITIDTKTTDGFVIEKIVKSGFGDLGYVKPGETKTQDVFRKEKVTVTGGQATATMSDAEIGASEKERFRKLLEKLVLKK
jgi:hypothetical protein